MELASYVSKIKFHVSGIEHTVSPDDVTPETTLNTYLRQKAHLTGTKRMCLEGGCGCCVVAVEETVNNEKNIFAVNSCLVSIFSCHGWKIHSIEGIGGPTTKYHPIQQLLADNNGTQCGYCSPGMVMNMYALHESGPKTQKEIEDAFGGNICRCTGYRPILTAFKKLASDADDKNFQNVDIEDLKICQKNICTRNCSKKCNKKNTNYYFALKESKWLKVYYLKDLLEVLRTAGSAKYMLVAGNTAKGVYGQTPLPDIYIDVTGVGELTTHSFNDDVLIIGGNVTLTHTIELFSTISAQNKNFAYLSDMAKHINLIANVPVRNIGTIAGNLMIKHTHNDFPSDMFLILETSNALIVIVDSDENEIMVSPQDFLKKDMNKKVIKNIVLNPYDFAYKFLSYKIMARAQNTHAHVNAGFLLKFDNENVISARIVYGGINPDFVHATNTEKLLKGKHLFDNNVLQQAYQALDDEIKPDYVLPDAKPEFRKLLAISLFYKFVLNIAPEKYVSTRNRSGGSLLERPVSSGVQEFGTNTKNYPLGEPVIKVEALAQTSGQAEYIADVPDLPNQLFAAFVTAKAAANSQITSIDTSKALALKGVVAFFGKDDIPGENTFTPKMPNHFPVQEELFCSGRVQYYDQPIGIVVANDQDLVVKAADLVEVTYSKSNKKPYLTVKDVLNAKDKDRIKHETTMLPKRKGNDIKHVIKGDFYIGMQYHFHMEVQCCNVVPTEDSLDLYPSTQWMDASQAACSYALNIPMNRINVNVRRLGGGFGAKILRNTLISTAAALAAYKLKKPVKMWLPLRRNMTTVGKRYPCYVTYEVGVDDKGVVQYLDADLYTDMGVGGNEPVDSNTVAMFQNCYDVSTWSFSTYSVITDTHANCYTRAPGTLEGLACIDSIMEHIAYSINKDASEIKVANTDSKKFPKAIEFWNDMQTWGDIPARKAAIQTFNTANRWKKRGMSLTPMAWNFEVAFNYTVLVSIFHGDGTVAVSHGGIEMGQGINTKVIQVCAYKFGIPISKVAVKPSYNVIAPNSSTTGGSATSESIVYALLKACDVLLERMKPVKDKMVNPTWEQLINKCFDANIQLVATGFYSEDEPGVQEYFIYGTCATEVEVDILTGQHQILRVDIIEDVGESMSPLIDIGQLEGAFVMGIGYYTTEEIIFNDEGEILTNRTWNYRPPGAKDIPINFRIKFPENNPNPIGVLRSKAIAEPPICLSCSLPLAIRNALASARAEAAADQPKWIPFDGPTTVEFTLSNSLNSYKQYVL